MIVSMKKFSFLVYHKEYQQFLEEIRERGVLHVKERGEADGSEGTLREKFLIINRLKDIIRFLKKREIKGAVVEKIPAKIDGLKILHDIESLRHEQEVLLQDMQLHEKDLHHLGPWGEFEWEEIDRLKEHGYEIRFYSCVARKWQTGWEEEYNAFEISRHGTSLYFVTLTKKDEKIDIEADLVKLPSHSMNWVNSEKAKILIERERIEGEYDKYASQYLEILEETKLAVQQELDFENIVINSGREVEEKVIVLEGFIPEAKEVEFKEYLDSQPVYYESHKPSAADKIPILLKNNWFAKLFEPIGELYAMPDYGEIDLTPFFAPFYMMFFGFCLGDAGYGLLMVIAAFYFRGKVKTKMKPLMSLIVLLGIATVIFGIIGGTFFGMNLIESEIEWLEKYKRFMLDPEQLFYLALIVGGIQILFGMFIKAFNQIKQKGFKYSLAVWGWLFLIIGGGGIYGLNLIGEVSDQLMKTTLIVILSISGVPILLLNNPDKNPLVNIGAGLWDTYNMMTGLLGDLLSYIRLFALGISSAVMGFVFNDLAMSLSPDIPVLGHLVMIIILLIGHSINIFMSGLGSFVHPIRLTFVEFYKNAGFTGGGKKYKPFKQLVNNEK